MPVTKVGRPLYGFGGANNNNLLGNMENRNEVKHGGKGRTGRAVVRSALMLLDEYQSANESPEVIQDRTSMTVR